MKTQWIYIKDFKNHIGEEIEFRGWVWNKRSGGKIAFLQLRDGTGFVQGIAEKKNFDEEQFEKIRKIKMESSVTIIGEIKRDERSPQNVELHIKNIEIIHEPKDDYPISKKEHGIDFLMENRHLWLRSKRQFHILRIRNEIIKAIRDFYNQNDFILIDTPIFTGSIGESAGNTFSLDYFDYGKVYLAQTGQLYLEAAAMALGKVYNLGPTFRSEKSKTRRHLIEFWMNEAEVAFYRHEDNMRLQENLVSYIVQKTLENASEDLKEIGRDITKLEKVTAPFERITYTKAIEFLNKKGFNISWGDDFGADEETAIASQFEKPVFVEKYPKKVKAFYMQPDETNPDVVLCDDLLAPEGYGEIIGASERIWKEEVLIERLKENNLPLDEYQWYLDLRRYGSVPHSGFGLGIERTVAWICGLEHIRESIPFARTLYRVYP
ncbi:asparagine--tRNA ligase [Petrotoga sp. 9PWA.NaAc.5.4]|uniref:asparagine--tRNA ligase n=1 Tax=Petrotoga sp. 9PWA.NaAc.5.4 TaxID=1434328 RepID=UPI000CA64F5E|nr:asparagine--tRNA ligase [Petrotoga sp. 9PWA.NaAc.5.4]PNR95295.1 asparaginyl-tRNA synthase [Petrotoga sp. 9PWA.NaAc.5.4]